MKIHVSNWIPFLPNANTGKYIDLMILFDKSLLNSFHALNRHSLWIRCSAPGRMLFNQLIKNFSSVFYCVRFYSSAKLNSNFFHFENFKRILKFSNGQCFNAEKSNSICSNEMNRVALEAVVVVVTTLPKLIFVVDWKDFGMWWKWMEFPATQYFRLWLWFCAMHWKFMLRTIVCEFQSQSINRYRSVSDPSIELLLKSQSVNFKMNSV